MKNLITTLAILVAILLAVPARAVTYLVVGPPPDAMPRSSAETVFKTFPELVLRGEVGDRVLIYDGLNARLIAGTTIGSGSDKIRLKKSDAAIRQALAAYRQADADAAPSSPLNLPRIAREIIRPRLRAGEDVRVLVLGDPFDAIGGDPGGDYEPGELPADAFIFKEDTPWSTAGRDNDLDGALVTWVYMDDLGEADERDAAFDFTAKWFASQSATVTEVLPGGQLVAALQAVTSGKSDPWTDTVIDRGDTELVIRSLRGGARADRGDQEIEIEEARRIAAEKGRALVQRLGARGLLKEHPVTFVFLIDASSSWWGVRPDVLAAIDEGVGMMLDQSPWVRVGVVPFRGRDEAISRFDLQTIDEDRPSRGELTAFLKGIGSESSNVDIESACVTGMADLDRLDLQGRVCLVLLTDTDTREANGPNNGAPGRIEDAIERWVARDNDRRFMAAYVGDQTDSNEASFMRSLAAAADSRGAYVASREDLINELLTTALRE